MSNPQDYQVTETPACDQAGLASLRDQPAFLAALAAEFALTVPTTPAFTEADSIRLSCLAPGRYLVTAPRHSGLVARCTRAFATLAAITDQSDQWHTLILAGPGAPTALSRLVTINISPTAFPPGSLRLTSAAQIPLRLWHLQDATYQLCTPRSYATNLAHLLG